MAAVQKESRVGGGFLELGDDLLELAEVLREGLLAGLGEDAGGLRAVFPADLDSDTRPASWRIRR